jgi:DNA gyrase subunit A
VLNLKEILAHFVGHRKEVIIRRTRYDLKKAEERAHILEGLKIALDNLDAVVQLIRQSKSPAEAKERLIGTFNLSVIQAQAILDMRLQRLTGLERDKIIEEYRTCSRISNGSKRFWQRAAGAEPDQGQSWPNSKNSSATARTEIVESTRRLTMEDMIIEEDMVVTISNSGYIKRNPITLYQASGAAARARPAMGMKEEDFVSHLFIASTHHTFLFFTNRGKVYWCKVYDIPQAGRTGRGKAIVNLLNFEEGEHMTTVLAVPCLRTGPLCADGHQGRHCEEDRHHGLLASAGRRHHRFGPGRR